MGYCYNPQTGEHIRTDVPAPWMGRAGVPAPDYDPQTSSAFWRGDHWEIVQAGPTPEELLAQAKAARATEVDAIVVTTTTGKTFDGDERSQDRMGTTLAAIDDADLAVWVLADNGLDVHDGFSGRLLGHWPAPDGARLDRLEVDASGRLSVWSGTQCFEPVAGGALGGCGATCARPCAAAAGASERSISSSTGDGSFRRTA